jgi:phage tail-like protein
MAQDKDQIKASYPLPVYNYRVTINGDTLAFSEVSGLSLEYEPVYYRHGFSFVMGEKIIPGQHKPIRLTLKRGVIKGRDFLSKWLQDTYADPFKNSKQDILIDLCDEAGKPVVRWRVRGALPIKLDAPAFSATSIEAAIETLELAAHDIEVDYHPE